MTCQSNGICWWNVFMQVSKVDCISIYRWPISSHWDRLWYLKYLFVFLIERKLKTDAQESRPTESSNKDHTCGVQGVLDECGSEYPQCTTGHWMKRQILSSKWAPQANMSSSSLTSHQCKPSLKSPNQPIGRDGRQADGYPWADELLVPSPCPRMQLAICLRWCHAWSFWSRIPSAVWTQERI